MEVKDGEDPFADPWEKIRDGKRARVEKNLESRMRNQERAGVLPKGTATRTLKSKGRTREKGKMGGNADRDNVKSNAAPPGIPVDLSASKRDAPMTSQLRGKDSISAALTKTAVSTASLGRFDRLRDGEPTRKSAGSGGVSNSKKRKLASATDKAVLSTETAKDMKLLRTVLDGGGVAKEKARIKGQLSKGETAYDYEFNDGLGASTYKKKKGRYVCRSVVVSRPRRGLLTLSFDSLVLSELARSTLFP
jgi:regulator of ribosome biosynthesis